MGRIEYYLEAVPIWVLLPAVFIAGFVFLVSPPRLRLPMALAAMPGWLTLSFLNELGVAQQAAKASSPAAYLLIILATYLHPGPKRSVPGIVWLFPVMALISVPFVIGTIDRELAIVLRIQWFLLTVAAIGVSRVVVDDESLSMVIRALTVGSLFAVLLPFSAVVKNPDMAFSRGIGRFFPHGANPNQIGIVFALSAPLFLYSIIRARNQMWRLVMIGALSITGAMGLMTASRQTIGLMSAISFPLVLYLTRRPFITAVAGIILVGGMMILLKGAPNVDYERLSSLETGRVSTFKYYLDVIVERPFFGLLGTTGETALRSQDVGGHTHNAYLDMLYMGGLVYFVPMALVMGYAAISAIRLYRKRKQLWFDPLAITMLAGYLGMMLAHGMVGVFINYPTHAWSFFFVFVCCFSIMTWRQVDQHTQQVDQEVSEPGSWPQPVPI